jgi:hypothetical protein
LGSNSSYYSITSRFLVELTSNVSNFLIVEELTTHVILGETLKFRILLKNIKSTLLLKTTLVKFFSKRYKHKVTNILLCRNWIYNYFHFALNVTEFSNKIEIYLPQIVQFALHYVLKKWKSTRLSMHQRKTHLIFDLNTLHGGGAVTYQDHDKQVPAWLIKYKLLAFN